MTLVVRYLGRLAYADALHLQESLVASKLDGGDPCDYLLLLEHDPVYTLGRGADAADLRGADQQLGVPAHRTSRGGGVTFHGPGQLVAYPIVALRGRHRDVRRYVGRLEQAIVACCAEFGIAGESRAGAPGVWVNDAKLASIGIGIRRWVTFHGIALNVTTDLSYFDAIVPCRDARLQLTSLARLLSPVPTLEQVASAFERSFRREFEPAMAQEEVAA